MIREVNQASAINRDAGSHPITGDPVELEAAARASERSIREFPYYQHRYGERGRRFGSSDGAWLALLADHSQAEVDRQVLWLGRVLASRGMPQMLLERHLEILHEELMASYPERGGRYERLLRAAAMLRDERRELLGDHELAALARDFDAAVGPEWSARHPRMGEILVAAVVDERLGIPEAVTSLEAWMTDAERFPPSWIAATRRTIEAARAATP